MTNPETPIHHPGELLGPYELERLLGRGAAAEVWQAIETGDLGFRKRQALKLLRPPPGEMEAQKKALITEARVCGHLKHPGVVDVYRVGEHSGEIYVAMEFVDGPDLNTLLEGLRFDRVEIPIPVCIEMAIEICDALDHAHTAKADDGSALQIIHRDLKPSNILVDRRGVLKISDWGLVKSSINLESTTRGVVKGTPGYIAPEVWGGTRDFRPSVDLFAVGAMLYEFVVGERLFQGRNLARIAEQVARRKPEDEAAELAPRAPELVPVVARLLQRVPANRHQTAEEVSAALREIHAATDTRQTLKDFLRDNSVLVEQIAPAVTGTGRVGADPEMTVETPLPGPPTLDSGAAEPLSAVGPAVLVPGQGAGIDQGAPTVADDPLAGEDAEPPTDPNLKPIGARPAPAAKKPTFEAPSTVTMDPSGQMPTAGSAFGPDGPIGTTDEEAAAVPATRAMAQIAMPGSEPDTEAAPVKATRLQAPPVPEEAADTIPPEAGRPLPQRPEAPSPPQSASESARKRKRKRHPAKRRRKGPPPKKRGTSKLALVAVAFGVALLIVGIVLVMTR